MSDRITRAVSVERLLGGELAAAAEETLIGVRLGAFYPALVTPLATAHGLLELYWDLRHQRLAAPVADTTLVALVRHRFGVSDGFPSEPVRADPPAASAGSDPAAWMEHLLGELSAAGGEQPVDAGFEVSGPALAVRLAATQILLALHWELRHQHPKPPATDDPGQAPPPGAGDDGMLEWVSALLCTPASVDQCPDDLAVPGWPGTPSARLGVHQP